MKLDHIGGKHIGIRTTEEGMVIRLLDDGKEFRMSSDAWFELVGLITAIKAVVDFDGEYSAE